MKKKIIKFILIALMIIWIISFSFANSATSPNTIWWEDPSFISRIADLLNIIWLPFAVIAGKLFTNDLVYGSLFGIDSVLWKIWQFSRTIANYTIWFIFIIWIFGYFIWKVQNIFQILGKIVIASVLVNASWFLLAVIIDLSTILLVAGWSMPMHLIWTSATKPINKIKYCSVIEIDPTSAWRELKETRNITICKEGSEKEMDAENFFSKMNSLTWPLVFIWSSILNVDKDWRMDAGQINENNDTKKSSKIRAFLHTMIVFLFVIPIILLVIIWIIRVFWLRIYISFSPLLVLDYIFGWKYVSSKNKALKLSNVIWLIFQPALVVMAMWVSVIFLATVQTAFIGWDDENKAKEELWICKESSLCINKKPVVTMEWSLAKDFMEEVGWIFGYIILTILSFVLMWWMIKLAFHSTEITSSIADSTFKFAEEWLKAVPIIPTKAWWVWVWAIQQFLNNKLIKRSFDEKAAEQAERLTGAINTMFGVWWNSIWISMEKKYLDELIKASKSWWQSSLRAVLKKFLSEVKNNKKTQDVIPEMDMYFKNVIYNFMQHMTKSDPNNTKLALKIAWLNSKEIEKFTKWELSKNDLFRKPEFQTIITWLIKDPNLLSSWTIDHVFTQAKSKGISSQLTKKIWEIK